MLSCWNEVASKRPSFLYLQMNLDRMLAAESNNAYIDFSINPENLCYQVADEVTSPTSDGLVRARLRDSRHGSRPLSMASNRISPSPSANLKESSASHAGPPQRFARTPSPTVEKPHASNSLGFGDEGKDGRRPHSMMLLQSRSGNAATDDDR